MRDGGVGGWATTVLVPEVIVVRLLGRLVRDEATPEAVMIDNAGLWSAQVRGLQRRYQQARPS